MFGVSDSAFRMPLFIGASLSEPHTSGTALQRRVCMPVCLSVCGHIPKNLPERMDTYISNLHTF